MATVLVGASSREVKDERERIARDVAGAAQAAVRPCAAPEIAEAILRINLS